MSSRDRERKRERERKLMCVFRENPFFSISTPLSRAASTKTKYSLHFVKHSRLPKIHSVAASYIFTA